MDPWAIPVWSLVGVVVWVLAIGGFVDHWRMRRPIPVAAMAAALTVAVGSAVTLTISAWRFVDPTVEVSGPGHFQRAMLFACGLVALAHLVRSRRRW